MQCEAGSSFRSFTLQNLREVSHLGKHYLSFSTASPLNLFHLTTIFTFYQRLEELLSDLENKAIYSEFFHLPCRVVPPKSQNSRESSSIPVQHYQLFMCVQREGTGFLVG